MHFVATQPHDVLQLRPAARHWHFIILQENLVQMQESLEAVLELIFLHFSDFTQSSSLSSSTESSDSDVSMSSNKKLGLW